MTKALPPAGWYPTSTNAGIEKWWDGLNWTEFARPMGPTDAPDVSAASADGEVTPAPRPQAKGPIGCFGLILGVTFVFCGIVFVVQLMASLAPDSDGEGRSVGEPQDRLVEPEPLLDVTYYVEGSAGTASLTMATPSGTEQATVALPLINTRGEIGVGHRASRGEFLYISAQNQDESGTVTCRITLDGVVVSENTSSGAYGIASCKHSVPH